MKKQDIIRLERTKRLNMPLAKKLKPYEIENVDKEEFLQRLMNVSDFFIDFQAQKWFIKNCKNNYQLMYAFQLLFQRAINQGHFYFLWEDFYYIVKNMDLSQMYNSFDQQIGNIDTLGIIKNKVKKIKIRCCAIPIDKKKGKIYCIEKLFIRNLPIRKIIKDYNIYIKFYPQKPENHGSWEAALTIAIYSAIYNKIFNLPSLILGGITKKGEIKSIEIPFETFINNQDPIQIFINIENNKNLQRSSFYSIVNVKNIQDITSRMKKSNDSREYKLYKDFLISSKRI
ncbi:hypothetical protein [Garciella nitratireducens]|uniref:hypothetical protein n=1 Tax=Garciella nitratireducens TaxID=218205 RepID=UPI001BD1CDA3|nr:hypothetical protein [Garciella nitratireducens]